MKSFTAMNSDNAWLVPIRSVRNAQARLFCFHYAGGSASMFQQWNALLPDALDIFAIQLPGRERRFNEPLVRDRETILHHAFRQIGPYVDRPAIFFGYSMGAILVFELLSRLQSHYRTCPMELIVAAAKAPHLSRDKDPISGLDEQQFIDKLREYDGTPVEILNDRDIMRLFMPMLRADFALAESYEWSERPSLKCRVTALGGAKDKWVSEAGLEAWRSVTQGAFEYRLLEGGHFFLHDRLPQVIEYVRAAMARLAPRSYESRRALVEVTE